MWWDLMVINGGLMLVSHEQWWFSTAILLNILPEGETHPKSSGMILCTAKLHFSKRSQPKAMFFGHRGVTSRQEVEGSTGAECLGHIGWYILNFRETTSTNNLPKVI